MQSVHEARTLNHRLDSWKEIASFFDRDERTVKRWEKERSLPIHRLPGSRGRVFAFSDELLHWMQSPHSANHEAPAAGDETAAEVAAGPSRLAGSAATASEDFHGAALHKARSFSPRSGKGLFFAVCVAVVLATLGMVLAFSRESSSTKIPSVRAAEKNIAAASKPKPSPYHPNAKAQELYLEGRYYWNKRTPDDLNKAVDFFTQAIVQDPSYAEAYVGLADSYNLMREYAAMPSEEAFPRALAAAWKAVELDDSSAEAHASLAFATLYWKWDLPTAEREFRRAIKLNPNYVDAHHWYATSLMLLGRFPEAIQEIDRAQQLDPASTSILADKALILFHQGKVDQATALLKQIEQSQPGFFSTHRYLSYVYLQKGNYRDYLAESLKSAELSHNEHELAIVHAAEQGAKSGGERGMLENTLQMEKKLYSEGHMAPFSVAATCALLGRRDEALQYLQASYERHDPYFLSIRVDEPFAALHTDPAFRSLVAKGGLPPLP